MSVETKGGLRDVTSGALKRYPRAAERLPDPGEEWTAAECDFDAVTIQVFSDCGVIRSVDKTKNGVNRWRTADGVGAWVDSHLSERSTTPCGHTGVRCLEARETYTCTDDECAETFGYEKALEVSR